MITGRQPLRKPAPFELNGVFQKPRAVVLPGRRRNFRIKFIAPGGNSQGKISPPQKAFLKKPPKIEKQILKYVKLFRKFFKKMNVVQWIIWYWRQKSDIFKTIIGFTSTCRASSRHNQKRYSLPSTNNVCLEFIRLK